MSVVVYADDARKSCLTWLAAVCGDHEPLPRRLYYVDALAMMASVAARELVTVASVVGDEGLKLVRFGASDGVFEAEVKVAAGGAPPLDPIAAFLCAKPRPARQAMEVMAAAFGARHEVRALIEGGGARFMVDGVAAESLAPLSLAELEEWLAAAPIDQVERLGREIARLEGLAP